VTHRSKSSIAPGPSIVTLIEITFAVSMSILTLWPPPVSGRGMDAITFPSKSNNSIVPVPSPSGSVVPTIVRPTTARPLVPAELKSKRKTPPKLFATGLSESRSSETINKFP